MKAPRIKQPAGALPTALRHTAAALAAVLVLSAGCGRESGPPAAARTPAPVIIIGLDTVRGDHVGACGGDVQTPHLDALAADGVAFRECQTTAPWTGPAFASLLTGLLPYRHGFLGGKYGRLADGFTTLPEMVAARGWPTASFTTVKWLTGFFGMDQGFAEVKSFYEPGTGRAAPDVTQRSLAFVQRHAAEPFLLFSHYFNAHAPYTPPAPYDGMYYDGDPRAPGRPVCDFLESDAVRLQAPGQNARLYRWLNGITDLEYPVRQYAADVTFTDASVGALLDGLKAAGVYDDALIVAVGDHGEHLGEHDFWFTHALPYRETVHVPLIVKFPGGRHAGAVVDRAVSITDVVPTVLAALGIAVPAGLDGVDLAPVIADPEAPSRSRLVAEQGSSEADYRKMLIGDGWTLLAHAAGGKLSYELYDRRSDPGETVDVAADHPDVVARLSRELWRICGERRLTAAAALPTLDLNARDRERLRSLGYVH